MKCVVVWVSALWLSCLFGQQCWRINRLQSFGSDLKLFVSGPQVTSKKENLGPCDIAVSLPSSQSIYKRYWNNMSAFLSDKTTQWTSVFADYWMRTVYSEVAVKGQSRDTPSIYVGKSTLRVANKQNKNFPACFSAGVDLLWHSLAPYYFDTLKIYILWKHFIAFALILLGLPCSLGTMFKGYSLDETHCASGFSSSCAATASPLFS